MNQPLKYEFALLTDAEPAAGLRAAEPARVWSEEEVEAIRKAALAEGDAMARRSLAASEEASRGRALEATASALASLDRNLKAAIAAVERGTAELAVAVGSAIAGQALAEAPLSVLRGLMSDVFAQLADEARVTITVHSSLVDAVQTEVADIAAETGFAGRVRVIAGTGHAADCRIDWGDGGLERRLDAIRREIAERLAAHGIAITGPAARKES